MPGLVSGGAGITEVRESWALSMGYSWSAEVSRHLESSRWVM